MVPLHGSAGSSDKPLDSKRGSPCLELFETVMTVCDDHARTICPAFVWHLIAVSVFVRARSLSSLLPCPRRLGSSPLCQRRSIWGERTFRGGGRRPKIAFIGGTGRVGGSHTHARANTLKHAQALAYTLARTHARMHASLSLLSKTLTRVRSHARTKGRGRCASLCG